MKATGVSKCKAKPGNVLVLRTCDENLRSYGGFEWKAKGYVKPIKWNPAAICGFGLHGLLWGEGEADLLNWSESAKWLVVEVREDRIVDLGGKVKFPLGRVVFCGDRVGATAYIAANGGAGRKIVGGTATAGYGGTATAGDGGTATAGDRGTATAGDGGTATAGVGGTATAGDGGTATAGVGGTATAGDGGTATAGVGGTATVGYGGTATAGVGGTATAGVGGTATAGDGGTATAGVGGTATAGDGGTATAGVGGTATVGYGGTATAGVGGTATVGYGGTIAIQYWNGKRYKVRIACIKDEDGDGDLLPNTKYRLDDNGLFVKA